MYYDSFIDRVDDAFVGRLVDGDDDAWNDLHFALTPRIQRKLERRRQLLYQGAHQDLARDAFLRCFHEAYIQFRENGKPELALPPKAFVEAFELAVVRTGWRFFVSSVRLREKESLKSDAIEEACDSPTAPGGVSLSDSGGGRNNARLERLFAILTPLEKERLGVYVKFHQNAEQAARALGISGSQMRRTIQRIREKAKEFEPGDEDE